VPVFLHRMVFYRRVWRGSVFSSFVLPVMFLLGMGISVGSYVDNNGGFGIPYVDFIAPGLLASTVFQIAVSEATYPIAAAFMWSRIYHGMRAAPLRPRDIVGGELLFISLRAGTSALGFLFVLLVAGVLHSPLAVLTLPVALLLALASCTPVLALSARITHDGMFAVLFRFVVIPATLFAGVFFPVDQMPLVARWIAYVLPLWHGVELSRGATLGVDTALGWAGHAGYLAIWAVGGYLLAHRAYVRRLTD
jgi:lipooligosaccharide transport system permease protein